MATFVAGCIAAAKDRTRMPCVLAERFIRFVVHPDLGDEPRPCYM